MIAHRRAAVAALAPLLAGLLLSAAGPAPTVFRSKDYAFEIAQPPGWATAKPPQPSIRAQLNAPDIDNTGANCNVTASAFHGMDGLTQAQINQKIQGGAAKADSVSEAKEMDPNAKVIAQNVIAVHGLAAQTSETAFTFKVGGTPVGMKLMKLITIVPGWVYNVNCTSLADAYGAKRAIFERVLRSFTVTRK